MLRLEEELRTLAQEAGKSLPPAAVAALVAEARGHLEESIQARLELGMAPDEAEQEALAAFGSARELARVSGRGPVIDRPFLFACLSVVAFYGLVGLVRTPGLLAPLYVVGLAAHLAFILTSVYARRVQFAALAVVLGPLWAGWALFGAATHVEVPTLEGTDRMNRAWIADDVQSLRDEAARLRGDRAKLEDSYEIFLKGGGDLSPSRSPSFWDDGSLRLFHRKDHQTAAALWRAAESNGGIYLSERTALSLEAQAEKIETASDAPWWPCLPRELVFALGDAVGPVAAAYGAVHLVAFGVGRLLRRRRRNPGALA